MPTLQRLKLLFGKKANSLCLGFVLICHVLILLEHGGCAKALVYRWLTPLACQWRYGVAAAKGITVGSYRTCWHRRCPAVFSECRKSRTSPRVTSLGLSFRA